MEIGIRRLEKRTTTEVQQVKVRTEIIRKEKMKEIGICECED